MTPNVSKLRGKLIVLDGPDGAGKTVQGERLKRMLGDMGVAVLQCRDPGGTVIGERIRSVLLDHDLSKMDVNCETLLFMASRAQLMAEVIQPALLRGDTVICDRFVSATCAYQGAAGFDPRRILELAEFAVGGRWPDATIILDIEPEIGFSRIGRKPSHNGRKRQDAQQASLIPDSRPDAMEARPLEFHRRVRALFLELPYYYPRPVAIVDGSADPDTVSQRILEALDRVLG